MYQFDKIKLVIWDLDETFWQGTFSEGNVEIPDQNRRLIALLTDIGIVNSICSKNDEKQVLDLYMTGMSYTQIAKVLGRDEKATDNALSRAKQKVRELLKKEK